MEVKDETLALAFGNRLRELRVAAGCTQAELGERTDPPMQSQAIARYEAGDRGPSLAIVYRMAAALGVEVVALLPLTTETEAKSGKTDGVGVFRGHEAVNFLKRIPKGDPERARAFEMVLAWVKANGPVDPSAEQKRGRPAREKKGKAK